jgi:soluble lytic murein transglycosylase-like protein
MKLSFLIILFLLIIPSTYAESVSLKAIAQIESNGNPKAVGDKGRAFGLYQLHKEPIEDYNRHFKADFKHSEAFNPKVATKVANWYINQEIPRQLKRHRIKDTIPHRLEAWNRGPRRMARKKKMPRTTKRYLKNYMKYVK